MKTRMLLLISLTMLVMSLAACGGARTEEASPSPSPTSAPPATATTAPSPTPEPTDTPTATPQPTATLIPVSTQAAGTPGAAGTPETTGTPQATGASGATSTPRPTSTPQPATSNGGGSQPVMTDEVAALVDQLVHGDEATRRAAAQQLAAMGPQAAAAIPALIQALSDQSLDVRAVVAQALQALGPQASSAVPALIQALGSSSGDASAAIANTLRSLTGQDFGLDAARWQQWWQDQQATIAADRGVAGSGGPLSFPEPTQLDAWEQVEGGYRVTIIVRISGGTSPFVVRHDVETFVTTQREYPLVFTVNGCTINHTIAVDSGDGQTVSHSYFIRSPWCD